MTPRERDYVAGLCASQAGLSVDTDHGYLMEHRLGLVARREGYSSNTELVRALRDRGEERLVRAVVEAMAPAQTAFFREPEVFEALVRDLQAAAARGASLRVWSAGCGTGQEVYSLAMLLEERGVEEVGLFASDLCHRALEKARSGLYSPFEAQQGLSARRLVRHFANADEAFLLDAELRRRVRWRRMNLLEPPAGVGAFDVILCRHVLGTLLPQARERAVANLVTALRPGGRLVLAPADTAVSGLEPIPGLPGGFEVAAGVRAAA